MFQWGRRGLVSKITVCTDTAEYEAFLGRCLQC